MTTKLSTESLRAMLAGITPDWREEDGTVYGPDPHMDGEVMICSTTMDPTDGLTEYDAHNARAIAALPDLLAEVIALRTELADLRALQVNGFDPLAAARDYPRLEAENAALRDALSLAASALDSGLNSGDAVSAGNDMDNALMQARAALGERT